ncbi:MAG: DUF5362 family protein [Bacteroidota bacterium]
METTEPEVQPTPEHEPVMVLNQEAQYYLQQAGKWASFLGIMGFIGSGLILLVAIFAGTLLSTISKFSPSPSPLTMMGPAIGVIYFIIAGIMFYINLNLYQFGTRIKSGIAFGDNRILTSSFDKLRSFFKIKGIILIVVISFYLLALIAVVIAGVGAASMMR